MCSCSIGAPRCANTGLTAGQTRSGQIYLRLVIRPDGKGLPGANTFARSAFCGKSRRLSVTRKSARPSSAQAQNGSSAGSGEIFLVVCGDINSASSRRRLMSNPIVSRRTLSRRSRALGLAAETAPERKPEIPATRTEVSTTPLGRLERAVGNDRYLRKRLANVAVRPDRIKNRSG